MFVHLQDRKSIVEMWHSLHRVLLLQLTFIFEEKPNKCGFVALGVSSLIRTEGAGY